MEHRDTATLGQFWGQASGGLPRSLSIRRSEFGWRLRDAGFAGAGEDGSRREIVGDSADESFGEEEYSSLWQLRFMNHHRRGRAGCPIIGTAGGGTFSPRGVARRRRGGIFPRPRPLPIGGDFLSPPCMFRRFSLLFVVVKG